MIKKDPPKTPEGLLPWDEYDDDEHTEVLKRLMDDGHSNISAAAALQTTPGTIAGFRFKNNIPSKNPPVTPRKKAPEEVPRTAVYVPTHPPQKLAASEATQCAYTDPKDGKRCGYERKPCSTFCELHP